MADRYATNFVKNPCVEQNGEGEAGGEEEESVETYASDNWVQRTAKEMELTHC